MKKILMLIPLLVFLGACSNQTDESMTTPPADTTITNTNTPATPPPAPPAPPEQ